MFLLLQLAPQDALPQLRPNASAESVLPFDYPLLLVALGLFLVMGAYLLFFYLRQRAALRKQTHKKLIPFEDALKALEKLGEKNPTLRQAALELSSLFRQILALETGDPALYETHEEFSLRPDALSSLPLEFREEARHYLQRLARLKYAPETQGAAPQELIQEGRQLISHVLTALRNKEDSTPSYPIN